MVSLLDDLFIFKTTSFQPSGTSSFASVSQSELSQQSSGSEPCSELAVEREGTAKECQSSSSGVDDSHPQPHGTFFLGPGTGGESVLPCLQVASNVEMISAMSHGRPHPHGFLEKSLTEEPSMSQA